MVKKSMDGKKSMKSTGIAVPKIFECIPTYGIATVLLPARFLLFRQLFTSAADRGVVKKVDVYIEMYLKPEKVG